MSATVQAVLMLLTPGADQDLTKLADHAPVVNLFVHTYAGAGLHRDRAAGGPRPGHRGLGPRRPRPHVPVQDLPGPGPRRPGTGGRLRDPGPTSTGRASDDAGRHLPLRVQPVATASRSTTPSRTTRAVQSGIGNYGPMTSHPPPDQDPRRLGRPATLPRHLPLARPPRRLLPRRPHRHPTAPEAATTTCRWSSRSTATCPRPGSTGHAA